MPPKGSKKLKAVEVLPVPKGETAAPIVDVVKPKRQRGPAKKDTSPTTTNPEANGAEVVLNGNATDETAPTKRVATKDAKSKKPRGTAKKETTKAAAVNKEKLNPANEDAEIKKAVPQKRRVKAKLLAIETVDDSGADELEELNAVPVKKVAASRRKKPESNEDNAVVAPAKKRAKKVAANVAETALKPEEVKGTSPVKKSVGRKKKEPSLPVEAVKVVAPAKKRAAVSRKKKEETPITEVEDVAAIAPKKRAAPKKAAKLVAEEEPEKIEADAAGQTTKKATSRNRKAAVSKSPVTKIAKKRKPLDIPEEDVDASSPPPKVSKKNASDLETVEQPTVDGSPLTIVNDVIEIQKEYKLKISSWNVAGLRGLVKKNGLEFVSKQNPDIFCMQEIKCLSDEVPEDAKIKGYHYYWNSKPGGHAGVALYSKVMPYNVDYGLAKADPDYEGRLITAEFSLFYLVCVYVPNSGRKLVTLPKRMRWNILFEDHLQKLNAKKPVIVCGDLNVSHLEIDLANPKTNKRSAGFTDEERDDMTKLLDSGFVDTFRMLYPDRLDAYTYWTYMSNARARNIGWRLDYFLVSERLRTKVVDNVIQSQVKGSDHCPITLFINI